MSRSVLIIGGSGKVARHITSLLSTESPPWTIHSLIRSESQIPSLQFLGATPIVHNIESTTVSDLSKLISGLRPKPEAIIWSAGAGGGDPSRTQKVDYEGALKAMDAAADAGVKRYIVVSALDMRDRENKPVPEWYNDDDAGRSDKLWGALGAYMRAKLAADKELVEGNERRGLRWTIIRPGSLSDEVGIGRVDAGRVHLGRPVSRQDVAAVVVGCLKNEDTVGLAFDVLGAGDGVGEKVQDAVGRVGRERVDCFEGYH